MGKSIIKVENLNISYGKNTIIKDANFEVKEGEIVLILGENGTGKSSIINAILKNLKGAEYSRNLYFKESIISSDKELDYFKRNIGLLPQDDDADKYYFRNIWKLVYDYCSESEGFLNYTKADIISEMDRVYNEIDCDRVYGVKNFKKHKLNKCSGGQKKLALILNCLSRTKSNLYILDEPLNSLDAYHARRLNNYLVKLVEQENHPGVLIITHCPIFQKVSRVYRIENNTLKIENSYEPKSCYGNCIVNGLFKEEKE